MVASHIRGLLPQQASWLVFCADVAAHEDPRGLELRTFVASQAERKVPFMLGKDQAVVRSGPWARIWNPLI